MNKKTNPPNAKDPRWIAPNALPGVSPAEYARDIPSSRGSAARKPADDGTAKASRRRDNA